MTRVDPYHPSTVLEFECPDCGTRVRAEHNLGLCPNCGGVLLDVSVTRE